MPDKIEEEESSEAEIIAHDMLNVSVQYRSRVDLLTALCAVAFTSGFDNRSSLPEVLTDQKYLNGFTGKSFRHVLNNLCRMKGGVYLEVGTFCGSSLICALYQNQDKLKKAYAIDNWSEFREHCDPAERFNLHRQAYIPSWTDEKLKVIEADCFSLDLSEIDEKVDIYFYDGAHKYEDHKRAFTYFNDVLNDVFIAVVDDWEKKKVREATQEAFNELNYTVIGKWEVTPPAGRKNKMERPDLHWWHGMAMFLVRKTPVSE
jgi:hypothetical protein